MSFGDGFIDPSLYELDEELKRVDELLGDAKLLKPFEEVFDDSMGRPGTAVGIYLRMMYLKFRWGLSYEEVEMEVRERLSWHYFCHLSLMDTVPDATTLIKLNQRFGEGRVGHLNKQLVGHVVKHRAIKPRRIRIDSTTLEAHIVPHRYRNPPSSGKNVYPPVGPVPWATRSSATCGLPREPSENFKIDVALIVQLRFSDVGQ
jgi:IS5 family transposase